MTRVRKGVKAARTRVRKEKLVHPTNPIYQTFNKIARLLGEMEAGMSALFLVIERAGLMAAPAGEVGTMGEAEATRVLQEAQAITDLLSYESKLVIPVLFLAVGDETAARVFGCESERPEGETVH